LADGRVDTTFLLQNVNTTVDAIKNVVLPDW